MTGSENWQQMRQKLAPEEVLRPQVVELRRLGLILLIALIHGLIYLFLVPPWQHYDEPNHFEYVWMVAHRFAEWERLPEPGDVHGRLSYRVIESMHKYGFYDRSPVPPEIPVPTQTLPIPGYSQLSEPPLYYLLASLPVRLFRPMVLLRQLYAARAVSLLLYLLTIIAAWGAARELTLPGHPLRWLAPCVLALLPGLAELMTAVNNDALAITVCSYFFWGSIRLLRRGTDVLTLLWVLASAGLAWFTKNTALIALLLLPLVILFAVLRGRLRPLAWLLLAAILIAGTAFALLVDDPAAWYRRTPQVNGLRQTFADLTPGYNSPTSLGSYALAIDPASEPAGAVSPSVYQVIPPTAANSLFGGPVTFGVWMWSDHPVQTGTPRLVAAGQTFSETVTLTTTPQFFAFTTDLPDGADRIWVFLPSSPPEAGRIAYDGMALAVGSFPVDTPPQIADPLAMGGVWGEQRFENLLRNPSFEKAGPRFRPVLSDLATRILPDHSNPSQLLGTLFDPAGSGYYYQITFRHLFQTFWARFGWGHVPLAWDWAYWLPALISVLAIIGCVIGAFRSSEELPWDVIVLAALAMLAASGFALVRGMVYLHIPGYYYPAARHLFPAIVPFALMLSAGWQGLVGGSRLIRMALILLMIILIILSLISIAAFYGNI